MENTSNDLLERLVRIETKIDAFQDDVKNVERVSNDNKNVIIAMQQKTDTLERDLKELQDRSLWNSRAVLGCVITSIGAIVVAIIKVAIGV